MFVVGICIFLYSYIFIMKKQTPLELYIFWKKISRGIQICYGIKGRMKGWQNMDLEKLIFGPSKSCLEKIDHWIFVLHPTSFLMPYLNSSWNFLSEKNVYFWYGRAKISQVKLSWSSRGAKIFRIGWRNASGGEFKTHGHIGIQWLIKIKLY